MLSALIKVLTVFIIFSYTTIHAGEDHHSHDEDSEFESHAAHEHGHATAQISFVNDSLIVNLTLPSMNVFGFEYAPKNHEQKILVTQMMSTLDDPKSIIAINPTGLCELASKNIASHIIDSLKPNEHGEHNASETEHNEEHHAKEDDHEDEHHNEHHTNEANHDEEHSDVSIHHKYICSKEKPTSINYNLFNFLPTLEEVEVQYISNSSQQIFTATKNQPLQKLN
ncbi:MAG: DUF2796 domain-containing protein [Gammaproteobacteria bacterium]